MLWVTPQKVISPRPFYSRTVQAHIMAVLSPLDKACGTMAQAHLGEGAVMDGHPDGALGAILGADGQPITGEVRCRVMCD